jgi:hypothetical protein
MKALQHEPLQQDAERNEQSGESWRQNPAQEARDLSEKAVVHSSDCDVVERMHGGSGL